MTQGLCLETFGILMLIHTGKTIIFVVNTLILCISWGLDLTKTMWDINLLGLSTSSCFFYVRTIKASRCTVLGVICQMLFIVVLALTSHLQKVAWTYSALTGNHSTIHTMGRITNSTTHACCWTVDGSWIAWFELQMHREDMQTPRWKALSPILLCYHVSQPMELKRNVVWKKMGPTWDQSGQCFHDRFQN